MIVVTISKWRQKLVWLLAAILVAAVLLGQMVGSGRSNLAGQSNTPAAVRQQDQPAAAPAAGEAAHLEGLLEKLRSFYRGE
ncbi:hypothetical protein E308F_21800 [Moorella sp. E308F]|uniref:hypothetical protein n=1 Tax=unclassified Neomoorella TaxID=2676739 RepID=UPI0010FFBC56|nr:MULTISPECIES: hypothetical protein [unclassified Moorella (in: firmicutes)]MDK2895545.1 hypothetical protein [Moorella sp. (in: firmicutes)]GEA15936.1 hypothetical protein E308F_21800 [Moorella sp. E308F]GEA19246.1 hypothetical protein E306M_23840 [Moorella sp. E306M]